MSLPFRASAAADGVTLASTYNAAAANLTAVDITLLFKAFREPGPILRAEFEFGSILISVKDETQRDVTLLNCRPTGREQHDKICEASRTFRYCRALDGSSVVAPLLAGEIADRIP